MSLVKLENATSAVTNQTIYTADSSDKIIQINVYAETLTGTGSIGINLAYTNDNGTQNLSPTTDFNPYTIKVLAGTSIVLSTVLHSVTKYNAYFVIAELWDLT